MMCKEGEGVGGGEGWAVGSKVGIWEGFEVGGRVGKLDGKIVGNAEGLGVVEGSGVGACDGLEVGVEVGGSEGVAVGCWEGLKLGAGEGFRVCTLTDRLLDKLVATPLEKLAPYTVLTISSTPLEKVRLARELAMLEAVVAEDALFLAVLPPATLGMYTSKLTVQEMGLARPRPPTPTERPSMRLPPRKS